MLRKIRGLMLFGALALGPIFAPARAATKPIALNVGGTLLLLPFQKVSATEIYSFKEGKGFPAAETVLASRGRYQLTLGAAPVLGTSANVPFASLQHRLNPSVFDTSNNELLFGVWVGKPSVGRSWIWGIKASVPLW